MLCKVVEAARYPLSLVVFTSTSTQGSEGYLTMLSVRTYYNAFVF